MKEEQVAFVVRLVTENCADEDRACCYYFIPMKVIIRLERKCIRKSVLL